jgi:WD40 repeat protein
VFPNGLWYALFVYQDSFETSWAPVSGVAFSPDSRRLYVGSEKVRVWEAKRF